MWDLGSASLQMDGRNRAGALAVSRLARPKSALRRRPFWRGKLMAASTLNGASWGRSARRISSRAKSGTSVERASAFEGAARGGLCGAGSRSERSGFIGQFGAASVWADLWNTGVGGVYRSNSVTLIPMALAFHSVFTYIPAHNASESYPSNIKELANLSN